MKLLTFAHAAEASEFIKNLPELKTRFDITSHLYLSPELAVLITGEGMDQVFLNLGKVLGQGLPLTGLINLGIAAALDGKLAKNDIVSIRTAYRHLPGGMEFKSYSSNDDLARWDCVSTFQRIQDLEKAKNLAYFGQVLDRELWATGALCDFYKIEFQSFKLISDYAWESESCALIKSKAQEYSCRLYEKFKQLSWGTEARQEEPSLPSGLYWTESLKRQFKALNKQWQIKYPEESIHNLCTHDIRKSKIHPKKKSMIFLQKIKNRLFPINTQIRKEIDDLIHDYLSEKIKIHYDPKLESTDLDIRLMISSQEDLNLCQQKLKSFPLQKIQQKIGGRNVP